jgi:hypothetical protein
MATQRSMGHERRRRHGIDDHSASFLTLQTDSSRCYQHLRNTNKIVGCSGEHEEPLDQAAAAMPGFAQTADRLDPPEQFLDPLALDRADAIAGMPGRPRIDRRAAVRDMRRAAARAATGDKVGGVIVLVSAPTVLPGLALLSIMSRGGRSLRPTVGLGKRASTMSPLRFSIIRCPMWQSLASLPAPLRNKRASGSVVEECVSFLRFSLWKSRSALRP